MKRKPHIVPINMGDHRLWRAKSRPDAVNAYLGSTPSSALRLLNSYRKKPIP